MTNDEARPANIMTNGAGGRVWGDWKRGVRAKAVSPLRFATAVHDALRGLTRQGEAMLAGVPRCCGSRTRASGAGGSSFSLPLL